MKLKDLCYDYPESLIAIEPSRPTRVMWVEPNVAPIEINLQELILRIPEGDVLVINNTKVLKRRIFADDGVEILFLDEVEKSAQHNTWKVLFPSKKLSIGDTLRFGNFTLKLLEKGRPQIVQISPAISEKDFEKMAELPLPPYIQKARNARHNVNQDQTWYQTAWAEKPGSMAAPTASLHFTQQDICEIKKRGVQVIELTLHVGLGTFLPVTVDDLDQHQMHSETYEISEASWNQILAAKKNTRNIWALGTTVTRVLESVFLSKELAGQTNILIQVGSQFNMVDRLLTNFHQPESTLLALVAGFSGLSEVKSAYQWAIQKEFKLFSYGDFSVWLK